MGRLSGFNGREIMRVAESDGWVHLRASGDHYVFRKPGIAENVSIPDHRPVKEGTLRTILTKMRMKPNDFLSAARK